MNKIKDLIRLMRPTQWIKNVFVFTGIIFGESFTNIPLLISVVLTSIAFALVSSCVYIINDMYDCENDKAHPKKKKRPLPAGQVSIKAAAILSLFLGITGFVIGWYVSTIVVAILILYTLLNIAYSIRLKHIVILDVYCIATGFMLRILAGTIGVGIHPSRWLLLCGLLITLFLGFAKRRAEIIALKNNKGEHREVLQMYSPIVLDTLGAICATGVIICYSLYTMSPEIIALHHTQNLIFTVPFVMYALFRYIYLVHSQESGGDPTHDLLKDKHIIISVLGWALLTLLLIARYR
jgi:4-hydroxybenzoate polyprenyltransferase